MSVSGNRVSIILEPDRLRPNGKPYNPFRVEPTVDYHRYGIDSARKGNRIQPL